MKNNKGIYIALLLLPLMVVGIGAMPTSVTVVSKDAVYTTSFMEAITGSYVGWCAPVAMLLNYCLFGMAVIYGFVKKDIWLKGIFGLSFVAMCLAVLPNLVQAELRIVPNVVVALLLGAQCVVARMMRKAPAAKAKPTGNRLGKH